MKQKREFKDGQVLLVVMLAMATLATVVLSVVSRSISEVSVTTREEESLRAFSAAEAGVEEALVTGTQQDIITGNLDTITKDLTGPSGTTGTDTTISTYTADVVRYPEDPKQFAYPFELLSGQAASVWLVTRDGDAILPCGPASPCFTGTSVSLCWGSGSATGPQIPAIVANVIYRAPSGDFAISPIGFDPVASRRSSGAAPNNFQAPTGGSCTVAGKNYSYRADISFGPTGFNIAGTPVLMRITTLYNETTPQSFGVTSANDFPIQGRKVTAAGNAGEVTRKIDAFLLNPEMPFIFDSAIYSPGDLTK